MGKKGTIKIIAGLIAGMSIHSILLKYTNRPESINHLKSEIDSYRGIISDYLIEFNWNSKDKQRIKEESLKGIVLELKKPHFNDVNFPIEEVDKLIDETMKEILG